MRRVVREIRRAPARLAVSVLALALGIAAIGVFAIPSVASHSLRASASDDRIAHIAVDVADTGDTDVVSSVEEVAGVAAAASQPTAGAVDTAGRVIALVGTLPGQEIDIVSTTTGREAVADDEIVVPEGFAPLGSTVTLAGNADSSTFTVVGFGGTSYFAGDDVGFTTVEAVRNVGGLVGDTRVVVRAVDSSPDALDSLSGEIVAALDGVTPMALPVTVPDGTHPIEDDIAQISTLIGLLGIVAGAVALVLLGSTVTTLIAERSHEVAVVRALGSPDRAVRRRLRRLAIGISAAALCIGLPLGIAVANVIARMVLDEFVGLTPGFAVSVPVLVGSTVFALVGARLVSARAARRVTRAPLVDALRDREGAPFGRRWTERLVARVRMLPVIDRIAARSGVHRPARALAVLAQIGAAVAALMVVTSLATTVNDFNASERAPWRWATWSTVPGAGLDIPVSVAEGDPDAEPIVEVTGVTVGWEVDVIGVDVDTVMLDTSSTSDSGVVAGRWIGGAGDVVVAAGFAERSGVEIGDDLEVRLASGDTTMRVVGLHGARGRQLFTDRSGLAVDLGRPQHANVIASLADAPPAELSGPVTTIHAAAVAEDETARRAILLIFGAIGVVVVAVAGLAVASGVAVNVHERRRELATLDAIGARSGRLRRMIAGELVPLASVGVVLGLVAGHWGAQAIIESFEAADAVEIGFTYATGAVPLAAVVAVGGCVLIAVLAVRRVMRSSTAELLRGAR